MRFCLPQMKEKDYEVLSTTPVHAQTTHFFSHNGLLESLRRAGVDGDTTNITPTSNLSSLSMVPPPKLDSKISDIFYNGARVYSHRTFIYSQSNSTVLIFTSCIRALAWARLFQDLGEFWSRYSFEIRTFINPSSFTFMFDTTPTSSDSSTIIQLNVCIVTEFADWDMACWDRCNNLILDSIVIDEAPLEKTVSNTIGLAEYFRRLQYRSMWIVSKDIVGSLTLKGGTRSYVWKNGHPIQIKANSLLWMIYGEPERRILDLLLAFEYTTIPKKPHTFKKIVDLLFNIYATTLDQTNLLEQDNYLYPYLSASMIMQHIKVFYVYNSREFWKSTTFLDRELNTNLMECTERMLSEKFLLEELKRVFQSYDEKRREYMTEIDLKPTDYDNSSERLTSSLSTNGTRYKKLIEKCYSYQDRAYSLMTLLGCHDSNKECNICYTNITISLSQPMYFISSCCRKLLCLSCYCKIQYTNRCSICRTDDERYHQIPIMFSSSTDDNLEQRGENEDNNIPNFNNLIPTYEVFESSNEIMDMLITKLEEWFMTRVYQQRHEEDNILLPPQPLYSSYYTRPQNKNVYWMILDISEGHIHSRHRKSNKASASLYFEVYDFWSSHVRCLPKSLYSTYNQQLHRKDDGDYRFGVHQQQSLQLYPRLYLYLFHVDDMKEMQYINTGIKWDGMTLFNFDTLEAYANDDFKNQLSKLHIPSSRILNPQLLLFIDTNRIEKSFHAR